MNKLSLRQKKILVRWLRCKKECEDVGIFKTSEALKAWEAEKGCEVLKGIERLLKLDYCDGYDIIEMEELLS